MILLDASALIALLHDEPGADVVAQALANDEGAISVVNLAEVLERGIRLEVDRELSALLTYLQKQVTIVPVTEADALTAAELYPSTRQPALSLADRLALATARRLDVPIFTADHAWADVPGIDVRLIR